MNFRLQDSTVRSGAEETFMVNLRAEATEYTHIRACLPND